MNKQMKRCMKKIIAAAMVLALVSGIVPAAPIADMVSKASITAKAVEGTENEIGFELDEDGLLTLKSGTYTDPVFSDELNKSSVKKIQAQDGVKLVGNCSELFYQMWNVTSADLSNVDVSEVTDMSGMFHYVNSLERVNLSGWDAGNVTTMKDMFAVSDSYRGIYSLNLTGFKTSSKLTNTSGMFQNCAKLYELDLSGFDTSGVTDMSGMFSGCSGFTSLDLSNFDTSNVTDMSGMFSGCSNIKSLNINNLDTSSVVNMSEMFSFNAGFCGLDITKLDMSNVENISRMFYCCDFTEFDLTKLNLPKVTDMSGLFASCSSLKTVNMSGLDLSKVKDMSEMFDYCSSLTNVDFSNVKTYDLEDMHEMFYNCKSLVTVDLSSFDTHNVKNMSGMFMCYYYHTYAGEGRPDSSLKTITFGDKFTTPSVTNMSQMFYGCTQLEALDLSTFDTTNVTSKASLFGKYTDKLKSITLSDKMSIDEECRLYNATSEFMGISGWGADSDPYTVVSGEGEYAVIPAAPAGQTVTYMTVSNTPDIKWTYSNAVLTIHSGAFTGKYGDRSFTTALTKMVNINEVKKIVAESGVSFSGSLSYLLSGYESNVIEEIDLSAADMTGVSSLNNPFSGCKNLKKVSLGKTSTTLTSLENLFAYIPSIESVDLTRLDTSKVTNMNSMFSGCTNLEVLDLSSFSSASCTNSNYAFSSAGIREITISDDFAVSTGMSLKNSGTSNDMKTTVLGWYKDNNETIVSGSENYAAFSGAGTYKMKETATGIDYEVSGDTLILKSGTYDYKDIYGVFSYVNNAYGAVISSVTTESGTALKGSGTFFSGSYNSACKNLKSIDLSNADFSQVTAMDYMFYQCTNLESVKFPENINMSNVTGLSSVFRECSSLKSVDLSHFNTSAVKYFSYMFYGCKALTEIDLGSFTFEGSSSTSSPFSSMFDSCTSLNKIVIPEGMNITADAKLKNCYTNPDYTEVILGWKKTGSDEVISGSGDYAVISESGTFVPAKESLDYSYDGAVLTINSGSYDNSAIKSIVNNCSGDVKKIVIKDGVKFIKSCNYMFSFNGSGVEVVLEGNVDASSVTNMAGMFSKCRGDVLDLSGLDSSSVETLGSMFSEASIDTVILGGKFDTSKVTNMSYMFSSSNVHDVDLSKLDTSAVTDVSYMFRACTYVNNIISGLRIPAAENLQGMFFGSPLKNMDLRNSGLSKPSKMTQMFRNCSKLESVSFGTFDASAVKDMSYLFAGCTMLESVSSESKFTAVTNLSYLFDGCIAVEEIDFSMFEGAKPTNFTYSFQNCSNLKKINNFTSVDFSGCSGWIAMFNGCSSLEEIDTSGFVYASNSFTSSYGTQYMFKGCAKLKEIDLSSLVLKNFYMNEMFSGCTSLETLKFADTMGSTSITASYLENMFDGAAKLTTLKLPVGMAVYTSYQHLVNGDTVYTGWYKADDETKTVVSGTANYAAIASNSESVTYKRDMKTYEKAQVLGASLTLEGQIGVNFYAQFPQELIDSDKAYVIMSGTSGKQKVMLSEAEFDRTKGYKFTYRVPAKRIHDKVSISVYDGTNEEPVEFINANGEAIENNTYSYAVIDYINAVKNNTSYNNNLRNLVKALEIYGTYAQTYFKYDNKEEYLSSCDQTALGTVNGYDYSSLEGFKYSAVDLPEGLEFNGYSLILESETSMKLFFTSKDIDAYSMRFNYSGYGDTPLECGENKYYLEMKNIAANGLGKNINVQITEKNSTSEYYEDWILSASPLSYAYSVLKQLDGSTKEDDIALCNVMKAMYYYYTCAKSYFG